MMILYTGVIHDFIDKDQGEEFRCIILVHGAPFANIV